MTDDEISALLRSDNPLVLVEAPAGCGKTHQAASYARETAQNLRGKKVLVLTHTHAACSVVAERTHEFRRNVDIRTLDGFIYEIANAYRIALGLPEDVAHWVRQGNSNRHLELASKVSLFLTANPMVCHVIAKRYPIVVCDEHQDSSPQQEAAVMSIHKGGARLRIFGDPMQAIPGGQGQAAAVVQIWNRWETLKQNSAFGELRTPHRWSETNPAIGDWILAARQTLKDGQSISLSENLPEGLVLLKAENGAYPGQPFRLNPAGNSWGPINQHVNRDVGMLCLAARGNSISGLRSTFKERLPIWEGHVRSRLEALVTTFENAPNADNSHLDSFVDFLKNVLTGFTANFAARLKQECENLSSNPGGAIPPQMKAMAQLIRDNQGHVGYAKAARHLRQLVEEAAQGFDQIRVDYPRELGDLIQLAKFSNASDGLAEIMQRRSLSHPKPPRKCLSTVHKAKGLEAQQVILFACDFSHFQDNLAKRNLLYVALSRTTDRLTLVVSQNQPSPLLGIAT